MARLYEFLQPGSSKSIPVHGVLEQPRRELDPQLPDRLIESAGAFPQDGLDVTVICTIHEWASVAVPIRCEAYVGCPFCKVERQEVHGRARYADLVAKQAAGLLFLLERHE